MKYASELKPGIVDKRKSFYGKAIIVNDGETVTLYSYGTKVAEVGPHHVSVTRNPAHLTQTTMRHMREFLAQTTGLVDITKKDILTSRIFDDLAA